MAMTLRFTEDDARRLRETAEREGTSMHEVAISAVRARIGDDTTERDAILADIVARRRSMLDELAEL